MFFAKKIGCRLFQAAFRAAMPILPYREQKIVPSCADLGAVLQREGARSVLIVTDAVIMPYVLESYGDNVHKSCIAWVLPQVFAGRTIPMKRGR